MVRSTAARNAAAILAAAAMFVSASVAVYGLAGKSTIDNSVQTDEFTASVQTTREASVSALETEPAETMVTAFEFRKAGVEEYNTAVSAVRTTTTTAEASSEAEETTETEETPEPELKAIDSTEIYATQSVNFRRGPSLNDDIIYILDEGDSLIADGITEDSEWYSVLDDEGIAGFVMKQFFTDAAPESETTETAAKATTAAAETAAPAETTAAETTTTASETTTTTQATEQAPVSTGVISYTETEFTMMCYVLQNEVGYCSEQSKLAVANVIINRVKSGLFPDSIAGVLTAPNQFTAVSNYYNGVNPPTENTIECARRALNGEGASLVGDATFYYSPKYCGGSTAAWFESLTFCAELEGQRFFKN